MNKTLTKEQTDNTTSSFSIEENIWDEIIKSITEKMPLQLLPLIEEVFHKHYPPGTTVKLLSTDHIVPAKDSAHHMSKISTDITILIQNDIYHIECQMNHDKEMVVSVLFPDGSNHQYSVPTVKVQTYSLYEIRKKHLTLFIPFMLLSFRPRLTSKQNPITSKELTDYVGELIVILETELHNGNLSMTQFQDYIKLLNYAAERIFHSYKQYEQEVKNMTKSILSLPSDKIDELEATIAEKDTALAEKDITIKILTEQLINAGIKPRTSEHA